LSNRFQVGLDVSVNDRKEEHSFIRQWLADLVERSLKYSTTTQNELNKHLARI